MIEVRTIWIPQIIAYAEIVSQRDILHNCWVFDQCGVTSVTSFDEMIEQIFGDLDSDNLLKDAQRDTALPTRILTSISGFLETIKEIDRAQAAGEWADNPEALLASAEWQTVVDWANDLVSVAASVGYESMR